MNKEHAHRFDIIEILLNQHPVALRGMEGQIKRWRRLGVKGKGDLLSSSYRIGSRVFAVAVRLVRNPVFLESWQSDAREVIAPYLFEHFDATDIAVFCIARKSDHSTHDACSFFRINSASKLA